MKLKSLSAAMIAAGVLVTTAGAFSLRPAWFKSDEHVAAAQTAQVAPAGAIAPAAAAVVPAAPIPLVSAQAVPNYRAIVKQAGPAVVGVTVEGMHRTTAEDLGLPPGAENDPFFQFFRGLPGFQGRGRQNPSVPFRGQGSGFIISSDGLILTNAHVVREAKDVTVKLSDRREFPAKVLGSDAATDIAVLRINAKDLPTVRLGDPSQLEVGDPVLAIGSPFGFEQTATQGIVSAKGRSLPGDAVVPFIQTDAAVNPGNSGGPLFDGSGAVVGINAQIYSQSGGYQGLAFAIPINVALKVKDQIVATGKASHARLGVTVQDLNQSLAESFGLHRPDGALVASVAPSSAAAAAGLKPGDVITQVNGETIDRSGALSSLIGMSAPGERVKLKVWRDRASRDVEVKLGGAKESSKELAEGDAVAPGGQLGLALRPLTRDERRQVHVDQGGLVVENASGAAARAGIEPGDVLLAINGKPVQSVEQVKSVLQGKPRSVALLVQREGEKIFVPVNLG
ncbi:Do family serine endopeptidase [Piscinibacter sp.]|jgi:serine protease Do|uniref:Do family serine endopeptidase n=1 Tax=Piscinibacter sp. TaxID=1903157 RepID=UPI002F3E91FC